MGHSITARTLRSSASEFSGLPTTDDASKRTLELLHSQVWCCHPHQDSQLACTFPPHLIPSALHRPGGDKSEYGLRCSATFRHVELGSNSLACASFLGIRVLDPHMASRVLLALGYDLWRNQCVDRLETLSGGLVVNPGVYIGPSMVQRSL